MRLPNYGNRCLPRYAARLKDAWEIVACAHFLDLKRDRSIIMIKVLVD
jgi:hypothetical protein